MITRLNADQIVRDVIVIGASTGGVGAVSRLLSLMPASLPARIGVVIHRGAWSKADWSRTVGRRTPLAVVQPVNGEALREGSVYLAPSDHHMTLRDGCISLDRGPKEHFTRPAVDPLFVSAAQAYGARVTGIVLTGIGNDGASGLRHVTAAGGLSLVQKPEESAAPEMPARAIARDVVLASLALDELADAVVKFVHGLCVDVRVAEGIRTDRVRSS